MSTTTRAEAQIVISAMDKASAVFERLEDKINAVLAPARRVQTLFHGATQVTGLDKMGVAVGNLRRRMEGLPVVGAAFAVGGVSAVTTGLIRNAAAANAAIGKFHELNEIYGVGKEALQVYAELGAESDVSVDAFAQAYKKMQMKLVEAQAGDKGALEAFANVGINGKQIKGSGLEVFKLVSDEFAKATLEGGADHKVAFATALFGKSGDGLISILNKGSAAYAETLALLRSEDRLYSDSQSAMADEVDDAWQKSLRRVAGARNAAGLAMGPTLAAMSRSIDTLLNGPQRTELNDTFKRMGDTIGEVAPKFIEKIPEVVASVDKLLRGIGRAADLVGWDKLLLGAALFVASPFIASTIGMAGSLLSVGAAAVSTGARVAILAGGPLIGWLRGTAGALQLVGLSGAKAWALTLGPVALIGAAVAGAAYLIYRNWEGITSFFGGVGEGIVQGLAPLQPAFDVIGQAAGWAGEKVGELWSWFTGLFGSTAESTQGLQDWSSAGQSAGSIVAGIFKALLAPITAVWDALKLVGAGLKVLSGGKFEFTSSTLGLFKSEPADKDGLGPLGQPRIGTQRSEVGGRVNIHVTSDGRPEVKSVTSSNSNVLIDAYAGAMFMGS